MKTAFIFALLGSAGLLNTGVEGTRGSIFTYRYSSSRAGANIQETTLTKSAVSSTNFGSLWSYPVEGKTYAQPLYLRGVTVPGKGVRNLVYVGTSKNHFYAFDADSSNSAPIWRTDLNNPIPVADLDENPAATGEIGILATPVLDVDSQTIFVVAESKQNGQFYHQLHALDVATGQERPNSPINIGAHAPGTGQGSVNGRITYNPLRQLTRAGLALDRGIVYVGSGGWNDTPPYNGWLLGYDIKTLKLIHSFVTTPNGDKGGIWMSGGAPAIDATGNLYVATGNGAFNGIKDWGDSVLKLTPYADSMEIASFFTPADQERLNLEDLDQGSGGVTLIAKRKTKSLLVQAGKMGELEVLDQANLGGHTPDDSGAWQSIPGALAGRVFSTITYWNNKIYVHAAKDVLKVFYFEGERLHPTPIQQNAIIGGNRGGHSVISANGDNEAILFEVNGSADKQELIAYDADDVSKVLFRSSANPANQIVNGTKFVVPVVVNGKVYVGSDDRVYVFGLH